MMISETCTKENLLKQTVSFMWTAAFGPPERKKGRWTGCKAGGWSCKCLEIEGPEMLLGHPSQLETQVCDLITATA